MVSVFESINKTTFYQQWECKEKYLLATTTNATNCGTHKVQGKHKIAWQDEAQKTSKTSRKYMQAVHASIYTNN